MATKKRKTKAHGNGWHKTAPSGDFLLGLETFKRDVLPHLLQSLDVYAVTQNAALGHMRRVEDAMANAARHQANVERLLERIAVALEKGGRHDGN